jgi:hypothetical protein
MPRSLEWGRKTLDAAGQQPNTELLKLLCPLCVTGAGHTGYVRHCKTGSPTEAARPEWVAAIDVALAVRTERLCCTRVLEFDPCDTGTRSAYRG